MKSNDPNIVFMIKKDNPNLHYMMQNVSYHWFLIFAGIIIDHNQYRNDLVSKYNLIEEER